MLSLHRSMPRTQSTLALTPKGDPRVYECSVRGTRRCVRWPCKRGDGHECVGHVACVNVGRRARASVSAPDPQRRRLGSNEDVLPEGQ